MGTFEPAVPIVVTPFQAPEQEPTVEELQKPQVSGTELSEDATEREYRAARDAEAAALALHASLPKRKVGGNRRRGPLRTGNPAHKGRTVRETDDPIVRKRRAIAMPLWNKGLTAGEIRDKVNEFLQGEGLEPVSAETIRRDKRVIYDGWESDYDQSSAQNRVQHIAALNRMKAEAWDSYLEMKQRKMGGSTAAAQFLKLAIDAEAQLAVLDGSKKRAEVAAEREGMDAGSRMTRVYMGVNIEDLLGRQAPQPVVIEHEVPALPAPVLEVDAAHAD